MRIGDIDIPCVTSFDAGSSKRATEIIAPLGTNLHSIAEFEPDPINLEISGSLYKKYESNKAADQYAEDLQALNSRRSIWNYCHNVQGQYGFASISSISVDSRSDSKEVRDFSIDGILLPLSEYWGSVRTNPAVLFNTYGIGIDDCIAWATIPAGTQHAAVGSTRTINSEYGNLLQVAGYAHFMPTKQMESIGEVQVFDGETRIYSQSHLFEGTATVKNGLYSIEIDRGKSLATVSYWSGAEYTKIDDFVFYEFSHFYLKTVRPDMVEIVFSTGVKIVLEIGRCLMIDAALIYSDISPPDQVSGVDNYLTLGTDLYVASSREFQISGGTIEGIGKKWIFHATSDVAQEAKNCLVDLLAIYSVERRW